jgi:hypothetical protein
MAVYVCFWLTHGCIHVCVFLTNSWLYMCISFSHVYPITLIKVMVSNPRPSSAEYVKKKVIINDPF